MAGLLINLILSLINQYFQNLGFITSRTHPVVSDIRAVQEYSSYIKIFVGTVVLTPIFEELSFRYLLNFQQKAFKIGLSACLTMSIIVLGELNTLPVFEYIPSVLRFRFLLMFILIFAPTFVVVSFTENKLSLSQWLNNNLLRRYGMILFCNVMFATMHLYVVSSTDNAWFYITILSPYFFTGLIFTYARLKYGFVASVLTHAIFYLFLVSLNILLR